MIPEQKETAGAIHTFGHRLVDRMADYLEGVESRPVSTVSNRSTGRSLGGAMIPPLQRRGAQFPRRGDSKSRVWCNLWLQVDSSPAWLYNYSALDGQVARFAPGDYALRWQPCNHLGVILTACYLDICPLSP